MHKKTWLITAVISIALISLFAGAAFAAEAILLLDQTSPLVRTEFGGGAAYTMIWGGDVWFNGTKIGDFTGNMSKTVYTGYNGAIINYDIVIPISGAIGEFISVRTNHISTGSGSAKGIIYAASPAWSYMVGLPVDIFGDTLIITY